MEWRLDCWGAIWLASLFKEGGIHLCAAEGRSWSCALPRIIAFPPRLFSESPNSKHLICVWLNQEAALFLVPDLAGKMWAWCLVLSTLAWREWRKQPLVDLRTMQVTLSTWWLVGSFGIHKLYVPLQNSCRWSGLMIKYRHCFAQICSAVAILSMSGFTLQWVIKGAPPFWLLPGHLFQLAWGEFQFLPVLWVTAVNSRCKWLLFVFKI